MSTLVSGNVLGQSAVLLASPILTRLYTPEEFGVFAIFASLLGIVGIVSGLRYELAIPLTLTDGSAANILALDLDATFTNAAITTISESPSGSSSLHNKLSLFYSDGSNHMGYTRCESLRAGARKLFYNYNQ